MKKIYLLGLVLFILHACNEKPKQETPASKSDTPLRQSEEQRKYSVDIIPAEGNTFGYDIKQNDKVLIHQPHIPGVAGTRGFDTERQARAAAELMVSKLEKNIMPPTISEQELDSIMAK